MRILVTIGSAKCMLDSEGHCGTVCPQSIGLICNLVDVKTLYMHLIDRGLWSLEVPPGRMKGLPLHPCDRCTGISLGLRPATARPPPRYSRKWTNLATNSQKPQKVKDFGCTFQNNQP